MPLRLLVATVAIMSGTGAAQGDPLRSSECLLALRELEVQEAAAAAAVRRQAAGEPPGRPAAALLDPLRRHAAQACLASRPDSPPPARRLAQHPVSVAPVATPPAARTTTPPAGQVAQPTVRIPPLVSLTGCDPMGCWASDGTRLQRLGPALVGPRGVCSVQGAVLACP